jgi:dolichol-phosphate mannosyltransferase
MPDVSTLPVAPHPPTPLRDPDAGRRRTISVVVPALNEERHIADAVAQAILAIEPRFADYELLLVNDGSRDRTGSIMDALARENPRIRVTHNPSPRNLGGVYKQGIALARHEFLIMVPGDNENPASALFGPLDAVGRADMVVPYVKKPKRSPLRNLASFAYTMGMNLLFGLRVKYYNGTVIHRVESLRGIHVSTDSFAYQSEILVKLLRQGKSHVSVPIKIAPKEGRESKALRPKNLLAVLRAVIDLLVEVYLFPARRPVPLRGVHAR